MLLNEVKNWVKLREVALASKSQRAACNGKHQHAPLSLAHHLAFPRYRYRMQACSCRQAHFQARAGGVSVTLF